MWQYLANHVAERIVRFPVVLALVFLCFGLHPGAVYFPGWAMLGNAALLIAGTFITRFALQYTLATTCFYNERASSLESLSFIAYAFLSGMLAPLDLYPEVVQRVAAWTPFPYLIFAPARLAEPSLIDRRQLPRCPALRRRLPDQTRVGPLVVPLVAKG